MDQSATFYVARKLCFWFERSWLGLQAAWPVVKSVLGGYAASDVAFTFHTFPLPYHHHAFTASEGAHVVASSGKPVYDWLEAMFANQPSFGNSATANMTWNEVDTLFGNLAESTKAINIPADQFVASVNNPNFDEATRVSWKLSCARGVSGTPTFFVNGALSTADESWTVAQWKQLIDQLLG